MTPGLIICSVIAKSSWFCVVQGCPAFTTSLNSFQEGLKQCRDRSRSCTLILAEVGDKGSNMASDSMETTRTV